MAVAFGERLAGDIEAFKSRVYEDPTGVLDPEGEYHHEFVSGNHGRKLDFDKIVEGTDFYIHWVSIYARAIRALYPNRLPDALVGIANGANRLARDIAPLLGGKVLGLTTEKVDSKTVQLDDEATETILGSEEAISFVLTVEDVGTTGSTTATAINDLREVGVRRVEAVNFWQRNPSLPKLDDLRVPYSAVIPEVLPMFSPEACPVEGLCAQGVPLIPHDK